MIMDTHFNWPRRDDRRVVLLKSLATNNRFYALVTPDSGLHNADTVEEVPDDLLLGIAYPCLEDGLNDFAVVRTTYETLELFPDDEEIRAELLEIINDTRGKLLRRLMELIDRISTRRAYLLGTDLGDLKSYTLDLVRRGCPRRNLDGMMKVNVFMSVAEAEGHSNGSAPDYHYEFRYEHLLPRFADLPPLDFVVALVADVMDSALDDDNYEDKYTFDKNVFQKYIALMLANYAATDPVFYGTHRSDYGVSGDKDMANTPLYMAIAHELRRLESYTLITPKPGVAELREEIGEIQEETLKDAREQESPDEALEPVAHDAASEPETDKVAEPLYSVGQAVIQLPVPLMHESVLLGPISSICAAAHHLHAHSDIETTEFAKVILADASRLVQELKRLNIVSPLAYDPSVIHAPTRRDAGESTRPAASEPAAKSAPGTAREPES
jgi:hypothetical protein